jgi:hypothetical protein
MKSVVSTPKEDVLTWQEAIGSCMTPYPTFGQRIFKACKVLVAKLQSGNVADRWYILGKMGWCYKHRNQN